MLRLLTRNKISTIDVLKRTELFHCPISKIVQRSQTQLLYPKHHYSTQRSPEIKENDLNEKVSHDPKNSDTYQNEQIIKIIKKSKMLSKLQADPRFAHYFKKITTSGTIPMVTSFFVLHELTAIIPLFTVWYILYNLNIMENLEFSSELMTKCSNAIERLVGDKCQELDKHRLILSGAMSYALVKMIGPLRIIVSLWGAPYFCRWLIMPFKKIGNMIKTRT